MHVPPAPPSAGGRRGTLAWLIGSQLLLALSLLPWVVMFGLSAMAFDSGFSAGAWLLVLPIWIYPLLVLGGVIASWVMFSRRRHRAAALWSLGPLLYGVALIVVLGGLAAI